MAEERKFIARLQITGADQVRTQAEQAARSVEQAGARMQSSWQRIGTQAEGLESGFKKLNRGVNDARGAIELVSGAIPGLDSTFGTLVRTIGNVADVFGTLSAIALKNPLGLIATGVAAAASALVLFSSSAKGAEKDVDALTGEFTAGARQVPEFTEAIKLANDEIAKLQQRLKDLGPGPGELAARGLDRIKAELRELDKQIAVSTGGAVSGSGVGFEGTAVLRARLEERRKVLQEALDKATRLQGQIREAEDLSAIVSIERGSADMPKVVADRLRAEKQAREAALEASRSAAAEQRKQLDALISRYAPAVKAEGDLAAAREQAIALAERGVLVGENYEAVLRGIADAEFAASEEGKKRAEIQAFAARVAEETATAEERYEEALRKTEEALKAGAITQEQANRKREAETKKLERTQNEIGDDAKRARDNARELGLAFSSAFEDAIVGGKKMQDVIKGLGQDLLRVFIRRQLTEPLLELFSVISSGGKGGGKGGGAGDILDTIFGGIFRIQAPNPTTGIPAFASLISSTGGLYASGAAFDRGNVIPFARGGVVERPTVFPMARGMGLMGEAGPEAVMPLARDNQGRLGVRGGGPSVVIHQTIDARNADASLRRELPAMMDRTKRETIAAVEALFDKGGSFARKSGRRSA